MNKTIKLFAILGATIIFLIAVLMGTIYLAYTYLDNNVPAAVLESPDTDSFTVVTLNKADITLQDQIGAEVELAQAENLIPIVYFSATWCPPCQAIKKTLDDPLMIDAFSGTHIIEVDVDEWEDDLLDAGYIIEFIPTFAHVDQLGYPTGVMVDGGAWGADIPANMAPVLKSFFQNNELSQEASR